MSPPRSRWRQVVALPGAPALLAGAAVGRLAYGAMPVAVFLSLLHACSDVRTSAVLSAAQGLVGAVLFPWKGRRLDRYGGRALWYFAAACVLTAAACWTVSAWTWLLFTALVGVSATSPPVTSTVRAALSARLTERPELRDPAYALDAALEEAAFLAGPALGGLGVALLGGGLTILLVAALLAAASLLLAPTVAPGTTPTKATRSRLRTGTYLIAGLLTTAALAQGLIAATIALAAQGLQSSSLYGVLLSLDGVGALVGVLAWGTFSPRMSSTARLVVLSAACPMLALPLAVSHATAALLIAVTLLGLPVAALVAALNAGVATVEHESRWNEAFSWLVTCQNLAGAAGFALGGVLGKSVGQAGPVLVGVLVMVAGSAVLVPTYLIGSWATSKRAT